MGNRFQIKVKWQFCREKKILFSTNGAATIGHLYANKRTPITF